MATWNDFKDFSEEDFINDPFFQEWVVAPDEEKSNFWQGFLSAHPSKKESIHNARVFLQSISFKEVWPVEEKVENYLGAALERINGKKTEALVYKMKKPKKPIYGTWWAAAAVLAFIVCGLLIWTNRHTPVTGTEPVITKSSKDVAPGSDKAILTLANGRQVVLDTAGNGSITQQGNVTVIKINGQLAYNKLDASTSEVLYNTISTPRGGQYQVVLADGTKAWLNSESSLRFPTAFTGKERKVELTGEGYFEVAHNEQQPFIVQSGEAEVQVMGTHFNVNGYADDPSMKVTLLEGRVKVRKNQAMVFLNPGQQAISQPGQDNIKVDYDVDTEEAVAWKNGMFIFNNTPLVNIMKQLERWYNVQVVYQGKIPEDTFNGNISRNNNLSEVLKVLEYSDIRFKIEGKTITVLP